MIMDPTIDYYAVLGVLPNAEDVVIRAAYRALAQRYHPDRFTGSENEANRRMSEINEAYQVLSDPVMRSKYDDLRGSNASASDPYFADDASAEPTGSDPLMRDWSVALKYYPDLLELNSRLARISWRLANTYRAYLLEAKVFADRVKLAQTMESDFLKLYFGSDPQLLDFARELIGSGNKAAAKALNEAIRVLGSSAGPQRVIRQIRIDFNLAQVSGDMRGDGNPLNWRS